MKKAFKKVTAAALAAAMVVSGAPMVFAADDQPKVMLDGSYVEFEDAVPENVNGRIMVPYRAMLESLEAQVSWDQQTKQVTAVTQEETLQFTIGQPEVLITYKDGTTKTTQMDVVPYVKDGRTYVGTRFMAEALDYTVGWDAGEKTAVIVDYNKIFENFDQDFSIMNKLSVADDSIDLTRPYETQMDMNIDVTLYETLVNAILATETGKQCDLSIVGEITALSQGVNTDMVMSFQVNVEDLLNQLSEEDKAEVQQVMDVFGNVEMQIKLNGETGDLYLASDLFSALDETIEENAWLHFNLYELYESAGIDLAEIMQLSESLVAGNTSMKELLMSALEGTASAMTVNAYMEAQSAYNALKAMMGDEAFDVRTSGGTTTYTSEFSGVDIVLAALADIPQQELGMTQAEIDQMVNALKEEMVIQGSISFSERGEKIVDSNIDLTFEMEGFQLSLSGGGTNASSQLSLSMDMQDGLKLTMTFEATSSQTTKTVDVNPPAGATVIELDSIMTGTGAEEVAAAA